MTGGNAGRECWQGMLTRNAYKERWQGTLAGNAGKVRHKVRHKERRQGTPARRPVIPGG